jgi:Holliday junction resolvasome RuvABC DNA-binding subunit
MLGAAGAESGETRAATGSETALAARRALETLGIPPKDASRRVESVLEKQADLSLEDTIRAALR